MLGVFAVAHPGSQAHHARDHGRRGMMASLVAVPDDPAAFRRPRHLDERCRATRPTRCHGASTTGARCSRSRTRIPITGIGLNMSSLETEPAEGAAQRLPAAYVETGIIGTLAYLALLISMGLVARHAMRFTQSGDHGRYERSVAVGFAACVIAFVLISVVSNVITAGGRPLVLRRLCRGRIRGHAVPARTRCFAVCLRPSRTTSPPWWACSGHGAPSHTTNPEAGASADPPRQQIPLPSRRRRGVHGGPRRPPGRGRPHGRLLRHGASAEHAPRVRAHFPAHIELEPPPPTV